MWFVVVFFFYIYFNVFYKKMDRIEYFIVKYKVNNFDILFFIIWGERFIVK